MLYSKEDQKPTVTGQVPVDDLEWGERPIPLYRLDEEPVAPKDACRIIRNDLLVEGNARLNLATFCQTYMEPEAEQLMAETLAKNAIDKSEYPRTSELENRCVNIIADLWNAPADQDFIGTSTVGSSEACMLAGMAMKFRWRQKAQAQGLDITAHKPNLVISAGYQVCWEKFCVYWDIELRQVPMKPGCACLDTQNIQQYLDEYTIGVVGILGITYTGGYDDIQALDRQMQQYNLKVAIPVPIHVDAASGGLFTPFIQPQLVWDFRLENVISINTSGHKYGLVYPGVGWVVWKDRAYLPEELVFKVSYLGGEMPTIAINFSRNASQIIGQYYNFLRLGRRGYTRIHQRTQYVACMLAAAVEKTGLFDIHADGSQMPIVCYSLKPGAASWDLYQLSDRLRMQGWQVPAYPLPLGLEHIIVHRYVCRQDLGPNLAAEFIEDLHTAIAALSPTDASAPGSPQGYTH